MKIKKIIVPVLLMIIAAISYAAINYGLNSVHVSVVDEFGKAAGDVNSIALYVPDTSTAATLYADAGKGSTITNPVLASSGNIKGSTVKAFSAYRNLDVVVTCDDGTVITKNNVSGGVRILRPGQSVISDSGRAAGLEIAKIVKTKAVTIGHPNDTNVDYTFTYAANTTEQKLELADIVPAWARVIDCVIICTEDPNSSAGDGAFTIDADHDNTGGTEYAGTADCNDLNDFTAMATGSVHPVAILASASSVYVNATPGQNWSTYDAGKWRCIVTYIDNNVIK